MFNLRRVASQEQKISTIESIEVSMSRMSEDGDCDTIYQNPTPLGDDYDYNSFSKSQFKNENLDL